MAVASDVPKESFRLSMLIYDTRYRSITIQVVVLLLFALFLAWLLNNTAQNLAIRGKQFNFGFLWQRAGYDIGQQLIPYTNDSNHFRALLVGLLNTLVVAILGCILATVLGVFIGVLRLSHNWLVGRLMTIYVEMFRNVPLLLWILLSYVILSETTPQPRDFRVTDEMAAAGEAPAASMILLDTVAVTNRGTNIPAPLFTRHPGSLDLGPLSVNLTLLGYVLVIGGSVWANRRLVAAARATQEATGVRPVTWWKSLLILFGPVIALSLALGLHLEIPELKGFNFAGGILVAHSFTALVIALALYTAAFIAEIVRAGIQAVSHGQTEAAYSLGLRPGQTLRLVVIPQALRVIIPPLTSQYLNLAKNSSLAAAIGYPDLVAIFAGTVLNQTGQAIEVIALTMAVYLTISLSISLLMNWYNRRVALVER
jgi:general L-amino acid transport system permease protein